jgi:uncharacterized repeat protein (TIGR01451 family)
MPSSFKLLKRTSAACVALGSLLVSGQALAGGTIPGQSVDNVASVNYSVNGVTQTVIRSAPGTGNSTPGTAGTNTSFLVDRKVDLFIAEVSGGPTIDVTPGSVNQVTTFFIRNDGNDAQGVALSAATFAAAVNSHASDFPMDNIRVFVESTAATNACTVPTQPGGMAFALGTDSAVNIPSLAVDNCTWVYIVADTPGTPTAADGDYSNVELSAVARQPNTLTAWTPNSGADTTGVDTVYVDANATVSAQDQYEIVTASFTVQKSSAVIEDFVSTAPNFKPIPGAQVEYTVTLTNTGGATAETVIIADPLPTQTTFLAGQYNAGASDVRVTVGSTDTFCVADPGDGDGDGCFLATSAGVTTLTVRNPVIANVAASGQVAVRFRVTIN